MKKTVKKKLHTFIKKLLQVFKMWPINVGEDVLSLTVEVKLKNGVSLGIKLYALSHDVLLNPISYSNSKSLTTLPKPRYTYIHAKIRMKCVPLKRKFKRGEKLGGYF